MGEEGKKKKEKTEKRKGRRFSGGRGEEGAKGRREKKREANALILDWPSLFFFNSFSSLQIFGFETISEFLEKHSKF